MGPNGSRTDNVSLETFGKEERGKKGKSGEQTNRETFL
jgi:hypothetical protein